MADPGDLRLFDDPDALFIRGSCRRAISLAKCYPIIPYPSKLVPEKGNFLLDRHTKIVVQYAPYWQEAAKLVDLVRQLEVWHYNTAGMQLTTASL